MILFATTTSAVAQNSDETVVANGTWTKKFARSRGEWSIVERNGQRFVILNDDFRTRGAPDLKIFLTPMDVSTVDNDNATKGSVFIAELSSKSGAQEYLILKEVDLTNFKSIIIHCEAYSKLWSAAALRQ
ncbi:MAG: DM13 domain-containing protein [Pseudomonadota bacterium]